MDGHPGLQGPLLDLMTLSPKQKVAIQNRFEFTSAALASLMHSHYDVRRAGIVPREDGWASWTPGGLLDFFR